MCVCVSGEGSLRALEGAWGAMEGGMKPGMGGEEGKLKVRAESRDRWWPKGAGEEPVMLTRNDGKVTN